MKYLLIILLLLFLGCGHRLTPEEQKEFEFKQKKIQESVSNWIKKYAMYPDSYEPKSWEEFSQSVSLRHNDPIPNSENYFIKHTHNILDKDSNMTTFSGHFILEYDFDVNIIETERSNSSGGAFPPLTTVWTNKFGRPLNTQDSLEFDQKQKEITKRFIKEMKESLENEELETTNEGGLDSLKKLIDTLEKKN